MTSSIRRKLIALTLVVTLVPVSIVLIMVAVRGIRDLRTDMVASSALMGSVVAEYGAAALAFDDREAADSALKVLGRHEELRDAALYDVQGRLFAAFSPPGHEFVLPQILTLPESVPSTELQGARVHVVRAVDHGGKRFGTLVLNTSTERLQKSVYAFVVGLGVLGVGIFVAAAMLAWAVEHMITRRLKRLGDVATRITQKEDYTVRASDGGGDEIGLLADAFNRMVAEIGRRQEQAQQAVRIRDEFLSVASHELRTPLTSLKLQVQSLLDVPPNFADADEARRMNASLALTDRQVRRLERLIGNLLDVSRIAVGRFQLAREPVDLSAVVRDVVQQFSAELSRSNVTVTTDLAPSVIGQWDPLRLEQVIVNLLSNAIKYGEGKPIAIRVSGDGKRARLEVRDGGVGVDAANHARIFERFERAVSVNYGGLGLGLYITRQIVEAHGGTIAVKSTLAEGATFTVEIPLEESTT
jgi:signal transduction histidine kinase